MDYNLQLYTSELDTYIKKFEDDSVPYTALKWMSDDGEMYYSVLVNACGYVVLEYIGNKVSDESKFTEHKQLRFSFSSTNRRPSHSSNGVLTPIGISRASSRLSELLAFYTESIGIK